MAQGEGGRRGGHGDGQHRAQRLQGRRALHRLALDDGDLLRGGAVVDPPGRSGLANLVAALLEKGGLYAKLWTRQSGGFLFAEEAAA